MLNRWPSQLALAQRPPCRTRLRVNGGPSAASESTVPSSVRAGERQMQQVSAPAGAVGESETRGATVNGQQGRAKDSTATGWA